MQTEEHARMIAQRLTAHGHSPSKLKDLAMQAGALGIGAVAGAAPDTPMRLASTAFAFEHLEIATYDLLKRLAEKAGDAETARVSDRILEEEEAAAELLGGSFGRVIELTLDEPARSPLPGVTPLGKPSERGPQPYEHGGPQDYKDKSAHAPLGQPPHISTPTDADNFTPPEPGYPAGQTAPHGGRVPDAEHPQPVGSTTPERDGA
jgi:hypothetical protein